jgi:hypothetical protein
LTQRLRFTGHDQNNLLQDRAKGFIIKR